MAMPALRNASFSVSVSMLLLPSMVMLAMAGLFYGLRRMMIKRLGGTTGDTCGAMVELMEAASLGLFALLY